MTISYLIVALLFVIVALLITLLGGKESNSVRVEDLVEQNRQVQASLKLLLESCDQNMAAVEDEITFDDVHNLLRDAQKYFVDSLNLIAERRDTEAAQVYDSAMERLVYAFAWVQEVYESNPAWVTESMRYAKLYGDLRVVHQLDGRYHAVVQNLASITVFMQGLEDVSSPIYAFFHDLMNMQRLKWEALVFYCSIREESLQIAIEGLGGEDVLPFTLDINGTQDPKVQEAYYENIGIAIDYVHGCVLSVGQGLEAAEADEDISEVDSSVGQWDC